MTLRHLEIFTAVCSQESITLAAEKLNMAQPAVSLAIKELEAFYQVKLFERMNRRIYITEAGRTLLQYADTILAQFQESVRVLRESGSSGRCRFGVQVTLGEARLPDILCRLARQLPQVTVQAHVCNSRETERMILQNELDFAVVDNITVSPGYVVTHLCREAMTAVCSPDYLPGRACVTPAELAAEKLLLRERGSGTRNSVDALFQAAGCSVVPVLESTSTATLLACAEAGLGITILPRSLAEPSVRAGRLRELPLAGGTFERDYFLVYHRSKYLTPSMRQVIDVIRESVV